MHVQVILNKFTKNNHTICWCERVILNKNTKNKHKHKNIHKHAQWLWLVNITENSYYSPANVPFYIHIALLWKVWRIIHIYITFRKVLSIWLHKFFATTEKAKTSYIKMSWKLCYNFGEDTFNYTYSKNVKSSKQINSSYT